MWSSAKIDFSRRVAPRDLPELMDGESSYEDFRGCLRSLEQINRWLLGYRPTLAWLKRLSPALRDHGSRDPVHIVDVGSGGGDLLRQIAGWARRRGIAVQLTGIDLWAVHPGGRSILDAVEKGLELPSDALAASREVLSRFGNMSSATVMFVLQRMMQQAQPGQRGCAMSFGPGLTAETMRFHAV